jgi:hypothetical protein
MTTLLNDLEGIFCDFGLENPIVPLPCVHIPLLYHYGSESNYQRFRYSYFIKKEPNSDQNDTYKCIISDVKYQPDNIYAAVDGFAGKCWIVTIDDGNHTFIKYYIRNWIDIVEYYKGKGLTFVDKILK